jgi:hypothetical protein
VSDDDNRRGIHTIFETTSEDYTTDSNFIEDSAEEAQQIQLIETESNAYFIKINLADIFSKHKENKIISYTDFLMNKDKFFQASYFNWELNASDILSQWLPEQTEALDRLFRLVQGSAGGGGLDYLFTNDADATVDSQFIVEQVTMYIKRIFGIDESETFDYSMVNKVFSRDFKIYIKKVACYPQLITKDIYDAASSIEVIKQVDREVEVNKP